jgi:hypothetical protein
MIRDGKTPETYPLKSDLREPQKAKKSGHQKLDSPESINGKDHATLIEGSKNCQMFQRRAIILPPVY